MTTLLILFFFVVPFYASESFPLLSLAVGDDTFLVGKVKEKYDTATLEFFDDGIVHFYDPISKKVMSFTDEEQFRGLFEVNILSRQRLSLADVIESSTIWNMLEQQQATYFSVTELKNVLNIIISFVDGKTESSKKHQEQINYVFKRFFYTVTSCKKESDYTKEEKNHTKAYDFFLKCVEQHVTNFFRDESCLYKKAIFGGATVLTVLNGLVGMAFMLNNPELGALFYSSLCTGPTAVFFTGGGTAYFYQYRQYQKCLQYIQQLQEKETEIKIPIDGLI